ncbi:MAG: serine hydroxymethyltransferase [Phycisphaerae bacterium]|nr:serine hydroxymethyltransferase [Phycisphaerae bacterium]
MCSCSCKRLSATANLGDSAIADPQIREIFARELDRQTGCINLIASENYASRAVLEATGSIFTNKYAEGYSSKRYYGGCKQMDDIETLAIDRAKAIFGVDHANVQPHSGSQANTAVYIAMLQPGDTILSLDLAHGGHLTAGLKVNISGKLYKIVHYGLDPKTEQLNMAAIRKQAQECRPKLIICGYSAYPRKIDFEAFGQIAREVGAYLMCDIAHIAGLVATGLHPSPVPFGDFVTSTTHKTLRGPRGGLTMCKGEYAKAIDSAVFPGIQGGPLMHAIAAKAVAFGEAMTPAFKEYQRSIVANAAALAEALKSRGYRLVTGGTENHLMLLDLRETCPDLTGADAESRLEAACIIVNKNLVPFDTRKPTQTSGIRIGTPAATTRGMTTSDMKRIAEWIDRILRADDGEAVANKTAQEVREFAGSLPIFPDRPTC